MGKNKKLNQIEDLAAAREVGDLEFRDCDGAPFGLRSGSKYGVPLVMPVYSHRSFRASPPNPINLGAFCGYAVVLHIHIAGLRPASPQKSRQAASRPNRNSSKP